MSQVWNFDGFTMVLILTPQQHLIGTAQSVDAKCPYWSLEWVVPITRFAVRCKPWQWQRVMMGHHDAWWGSCICAMHVVLEYLLFGHLTLFFSGRATWVPYLEFTISTYALTCWLSLHYLRGLKQVKSHPMPWPKFQNTKTRHVHNLLISHWTDSDPSFQHAKQPPVFGTKRFEWCEIILVSQIQSGTLHKNSGIGIFAEILLKQKQKLWIHQLRFHQKSLFIFKILSASVLTIGLKWKFIMTNRICPFHTKLGRI
jgi:hypothetical protein